MKTDGHLLQYTLNDGIPRDSLHPSPYKINLFVEFLVDQLLVQRDSSYQGTTE